MLSLCNKCKHLACIRDEFASDMSYSMHRLGRKGQIVLPQQRGSLEITRTSFGGSPRISKNTISKNIIVLLYIVIFTCICPGFTAAQCSGAGIQKTTAIGTTCLCTSRYYGTSCEFQNVEVACDYTPNYYNVGNDAAIADSIVSGQTIDIVIKLPMADGRIYTSVSVETCTESSFQALTLGSDVSPACDDSITITLNIADLQSICAFSQSDVVEANDLYRQYRGSVKVAYSDNVLVTSGSSITRTSAFTLPIDIKLQGNIAATTSTDVAVFSAFDLQAAISGLVISDGTPTSQVYISYGLPYPYTVSSFNPTLALSGGALVQSAVVTSPVSADKCDHAGATEYSYTNNVCFRTLTIDITHGSSCTLNGMYTINTIGITCGDNVPASDCPLSVEDTGSSVDFTLISENFCDGMGLNAIIDDAVTIAEFTTFHEEDVQSGTPTTQRAFIFGDDVWFKLSFVGLKIFSVTMDSLVTDLNANDHKFTMVDAGTNLGFDVVSQVYWFKHEITEAFVGVDPGPGNSQAAVVTVTVTTSYEEPVRRRRRRRRVVSRNDDSRNEDGFEEEAVSKDSSRDKVQYGSARGRRISFDDLKPNKPGVYETVDDESGENIAIDSEEVSSVTPTTTPRPKESKTPVRPDTPKQSGTTTTEISELATEVETSGEEGGPDSSPDTNTDTYELFDLKPNNPIGITPTATPAQGLATQSASPIPDSTTTLSSSKPSAPTKQPTIDDPIETAASTPASSPTPSSSVKPKPADSDEIDSNSDTGSGELPLTLKPNKPIGSSFVEEVKEEVVVEKQSVDSDEAEKLNSTESNGTEEGVANGGVFIIRGDDEDVEFVFQANVPLGASPTPKPQKAISATNNAENGDTGDDEDNAYDTINRLIEAGQGSVSTKFDFEGVIGKPLIWDTDAQPGTSITQGEQIVLNRRRSTMPARGQKI